MTTTPSTAAITLAAQLYTHLMELDERPFTGYVKEYAEINDRMAENALAHLHSYLTIVADQLDEEWTAMIAHTATPEAWEEFSS